jgi:hypothetical protein
METTRHRAVRVMGALPREIPNPRNQIPSKLQFPNSNSYSESIGLFLRLVIGYSLGFGFWSLGFLLRAWETAIVP